MAAFAQRASKNRAQPVRLEIRCHQCKPDTSPEPVLETASGLSSSKSRRLRIKGGRRSPTPAIWLVTIVDSTRQSVALKAPTQRRKPSLQGQQGWDRQTLHQANLGTPLARFRQM